MPDRAKRQTSTKRSAAEDKSPAAPDSSPERAVRRAILEAAVNAFGRSGYEAVKLRAVAEAAGVEREVVQRAFVDKAGLYAASAEHVLSTMRLHIGRTTAEASAEAMERGAMISEERARSLLTRVLYETAALFMSADSAPVARFMMREQQEPSPAFALLYNEFLGPSMDAMCVLVARLLHADADDPRVRLRAISIFGSVLVFRTARATMVEQLGWERLGSQEIAVAQSVIRETVRGLQPLQ